MAECFFLQPMRVDHIPAVGAIERLCFTQPWPAHAYRREIQENRMAYYEVVRVVECPDGAAGAGTGAASRASAEEERLATPSPAGSRVGSARQASEQGLLERLARLLRPAPEPVSPELEAELRSIVGYAGMWLMADEAHVTTIATHPDYRGRGVGELLLLGLINHALAVGAKWMTLEVRVSNDVAQALYRKYTFKEMGVRRGYYTDNREDAAVMWTDPLDSTSFREVLDRNRAQLAARLKCDG
ncbi:MAG: ribosomal protein S18-alanine N-acetyltransferase [Chloroflexi bacterium]|nr:ribosomal protein S18-alanine N-acetyltransferase [Chloroflexota bacterium]